jgi:hypothetical protein
VTASRESRDTVKNLATRRALLFAFAVVMMAIGIYWGNPFETYMNAADL